MHIKLLCVCNQGGIRYCVWITLIWEKFGMVSFIQQKRSVKLKWDAFPALKA